MFAVISHKGKQYKVYENKEYKIDLIGSDNKDEKITFSDVLLVSDGEKISVGTPNVKDAAVDAIVLGEISDKKVEVFKFHAKKRYKRTNGHKEKYNLVKILKIKTKNEK